MERTIYFYDLRPTVLNENINKTEPILINREGFLCYNCGYKLI